MLPARIAAMLAATRGSIRWHGSKRARGGRRICQSGRGSRRVARSSPWMTLSWPRRSRSLAVCLCLSVCACVGMCVGFRARIANNSKARPNSTHRHTDKRGSACGRAEARARWLRSGQHMKKQRACGMEGREQDVFVGKGVEGKA
eukprot:3633953-Rhodomonas_salina.2